MRDYSDRESERWKPASSRGTSRWLVAQSIVPGIFRPREEGQSQNDYGGVEGKGVVANAESFVPLLEKMSRAMRVKNHNVWDKEGKKHEVVASAETKGLLGTEEKCVLDLYRTKPLDADFLEKHCKGVEGEGRRKGILIGWPSLGRKLWKVFWKSKMREYVTAEMEKRKVAKEEEQKNAGEAKADARKEGEGEARSEETVALALPILIANSPPVETIAGEARVARQRAPLSNQRKS